MSIDGTIPDSQIIGVQQYSTGMPTGSDVPGIIVPPAVLQVLMKTSTALQPKPSAPPPHPQVTAPLAAIPLGYQFAFNQLTSPTPYGNTITAYRIYRNKSSNNFSGSQLIRTIIHDPTHQGAVTVQDSTGGNVNYFYFVTAVDSTGQESSQPGSFQASSVASGTANPNINDASGSTSSPSTNGTGYTIIPEMTLTFTTKGNKVLLIFTGSLGLFSSVDAAPSGNLAFFRDGSKISADYLIETTQTANGAVAYLTLAGLSLIDAPSAGSHTYTMQWKTSNSNDNLQANGTGRRLQAIELG